MIKNNTLRLIISIRSLKKILLTIILIGGFTNLQAATYYLKTAKRTDAELPSSWNTGGIGGGGTDASNFTTVGDEFIMTGSISGTLSTSNKVTFGAGVTLRIDGTSSLGYNSSNLNQNPPGIPTTYILDIEGTIKFSDTGQYRSGYFILGQNGTLITANSLGIGPMDSGTGSLSTKDPRYFYSTSNFEFNGANQSISPLPDGVTNVTLSGSGTKTLSTSLTIAGTMSMQGTASLSLNNQATVSYGTASTIEYKGTSSRTTGAEFPNNFAGYGGIIIDQSTGNTVTLNANKTALNGNLNIKSGNFDLSSYTVNRSTSGGTLSIVNDACLSIGGTNTFPGNYSTHVIGCTSNVYYNGASQTVANLNSSQSYGNLIISGTGTKTLPATTTTICSNFTVVSSIANATAGLTVGGNVDIQSSGTLTAGSYTINVAGNWTKNGTFTTTGTVNFNGTGVQNIGASNFNHITFTNAGVKTATGDITIAGNLTIGSNFAGSSYNISLTGNWINNGTFSCGTGTVIFTGSAAKTLGGSSTTTFKNLMINGTGGVTLGQTTFVSATVTMTSGLLTLGANNLYAGSTSGGSGTSYIKTDGEGRLTLNIIYNVKKTFPVGKSAYNPISITNNTVNGSDNFNIRVSDDPVTGTNDDTKTVKRRWYLNKDAAGTANITADITYNAGEGNGSFPCVNPKIAAYTGDTWVYTYQDATVNGTTYTGSGTLTNMTQLNDFWTLGCGGAFNATKLAVTNINPANPTMGVANTTITVQSQNDKNIPTLVYNPTAFNLSCTNTTFTPAIPTGTISYGNYETTINSITFTSTTNLQHNATVTATRTSGETLTAGTSAVFDVLYGGAIYEPKTSGNWSSVTWRKSTDGGSTWTDVTTLPTAFAANELINIPQAITLTANVTASFYSILIYGTLDMVSGTLTLNHSGSNDYKIQVFGTLKDSGGTLINSNTSYPAEIHGGTYWHAMNGSSIPVAIWSTQNSTVSTCKVTGITSTALTGGLDQTFQNFIWDNSGQTVSQTLGHDLTVNNTLTLSNGKLTTGSYRVIVALNGAIVRTNGYINGYMRRFIADAITTVDFPVGDALYYTPALITFAGTTAGNGYLDVSAVTAQPPLASGLSQTKYINRKWTVINNNVSGFTSYSSSFTFAENDKVGSPTTSLLRMRKLNATTWFTTNGAASGNTITASGLTSFSDFCVGEDDCSSTNLIWLGSTGTDWNTGSNWCGGNVPTAATDVTIPSSPTNQPVITTSGSCKSLNILSNASLTISGTNSLTVNGSWTNNGTFSANTGTVTFGGSSAAILSGTTAFYNLTINNTAGVTAVNSITVNNQLYLQSANPSLTVGALNTGSNTLGMLSASATVTGQGDVTGIVKRTHTFTPNTPYSFGSQYTVLNFMGTGTQPGEISCRISMGAAPAWKTGAIARYYSFAQTGTTGTDMVAFALHYSDGELNGNTESKLVLWDHHSSGTVEEHGRTAIDATNNWVGLSGLSISYAAPATLDDKQWMLADYSSAKNTWNGTTTEWGNVANWTYGTVPDSTNNVLIPAGKPYYPILTADVELGTFEMESGASMNAVSYNMTLFGKGEGWANQGTFIPGTGTIIMAHGVTDDVVSVSGTTQFHNITFTPNTFVRPAANSVIKISGDVNGDLSSIVDLSSYSNTVEYNGTDPQYIVDPLTTGYSNKGYYNLILSGSGTKTLVDNLDISGDFTNNGTLDTGTGTVSFIGTTAQTIGGSTATVFNNLTINNAGGVSGSTCLTVNGVLYLQSANVSDTQGALNVPADTLSMGATATTVGTSDFTGYVKRTGFTAGVYYSFGSAYTGCTFNAGSKFPTAIVSRITIGQGLSAQPAAVKRVYDLAQRGSDHTTVVTVRIHYQDAELNGNPEKELADYLYFTANGAFLDKGRSNNNMIENWVEISNVDVSAFPQKLGIMYTTLARSSVTSNTWTGGVSTDWNNQNNWNTNSIPTSVTNIIIPGGTNYDPTLPTSAEIVSLTLGPNAILNGGSATTLVVNGSQGAWSNNGGTLNPGTSTVKFTNSRATLSGASNFYNFTLDKDTTNLTITAGSVLGIAGTATITGKGYTTGDCTLEFNGADQNVELLNPALPTYSNLILSGTGTKNLPSVDFTVARNFTVKGTCTVTGSNSVHVTGDFSIDPDAAYTAASIANAVDGSFVNNGTFQTTGNAKVNINGNFENNGTFNQSGGEIFFRGSALQSLGGALPVTFYNLTVDNASGVQITDTLVNVTGRLTVNSAKTLEILGGREVIAGKITNHAGADGIVIRANEYGSNGTLIFNNQVDSTVQATVEMYSKAYALNYDNGTLKYSGYKWQYFGIPVRSLTATPAFDGSFVRSHDETTGTWTQLNNSSVLTPFTGYEITQAIARTLIYQGELENRDYSTNLNYTPSTSAYPGEYIFSNPYTCAIRISGLSFGQGLDATVYLFNTGSSADWSLYNSTKPAGYDNAGQYVAAPKIYSGIAGIPGNIPSMQGFEIKTNGDPGVSGTAFGISYNSVKYKNYDKQRTKAANAEPVYTIIDVQGMTYADRMWIFTDPACSRNFDNGYDGRKMFGSSAQIKIFALEADGDYQIDAVDDINNTPLGFQNGVDSVYTFKVTHSDNTSTRYEKLYLYDLQDKMLTDITASGTQYLFKASLATTPEKRFVILTSPYYDATPEVQKSKTYVITVGKRIFINNASDGNGDFRLYDLMGRVMFEKKYTSGMNSFDIHLPAATYLYNLTDDAGNVISDKIVIKNE
jgi:hypothetical protein